MANSSKEVATISEEKALVLSRVAGLIDVIPEAGGDGSAFIMNVLEAQSASDLIGDDSSEADDLEEMFGQLIRVDSVQRWKSDYEFDPTKGSITDQYIIVHGYNLDTNSDTVFAVGATTPIVKLAKLHGFRAFPAVVSFSKASKPTAQGFYPVNMSVVSVTDPVTVDA